MADNDAPKPKKKPRPKAPFEHMEKHCGKQVEQFLNSSLPDAQKTQLVEAFTGMHYCLQNVDMVADPDNPPGPDTAWGFLRELGRQIRSRTSRLDDLRLANEEPKNGAPAAEEKPEAPVGAGSAADQAGF